MKVQKLTANASPSVVFLSVLYVEPQRQLRRVYIFIYLSAARRISFQIKLELINLKNI